MTKAEQKRWNTWTNFMATITMMDKFYPQAVVHIHKYDYRLNAHVLLPNDEYLLNEFLNDLNEMVEEQTRVTIKNIPAKDLISLYIEWEVNEYDNEIH